MAQRKRNVLVGVVILAALVLLGLVISNRLMEGLASLVQATKRKARGYKNHDTFICITYLVAGKLDLRTHTM